jgi:hypothetical protein
MFPHFSGYPVLIDPMSLISVPYQHYIGHLSSARGKTMKKLAVITVLTFLIASLLMTSPAMATSPPDCVSVIIVFKDAVSTQDVSYLTAVGGMIKYTYTIINGVAADLPLASANKLKSLQKNPEAAGNDPLASRIKYIEDDRKMYAMGNEGASVGQPGVTVQAGAETPVVMAALSLPDSK